MRAGSGAGSRGGAGAGEGRGAGIRAASQVSPGHSDTGTMSLPDAEDRGRRRGGYFLVPATIRALPAFGRISLVWPSSHWTR